MDSFDLRQELQGVERHRDAVAELMHKSIDLRQDLKSSDIDFEGFQRIATTKERAQRIDDRADRSRGSKVWEHRRVSVEKSATLEVDDLQSEPSHFAQERRPLDVLISTHSVAKREIEP